MFEKEDQTTLPQQNMCTEQSSPITCAHELFRFPLLGRSYPHQLQKRSNKNTNKLKTDWNKKKWKYISCRKRGIFW